MSKRRLQVPSREDWAGYEADLDVRHAHKLFFGKSRAEVQRYFGGTQSISRADELLFMPRRAFQYYIFAFADFLHSEEARGDPDSASSFLRFVLAQEQRDPGSVAEIYDDLAPTLEFVASHQEYFDAEPDIYGSFQSVASDIQEACGTSQARNA